MPNPAVKKYQGDLGQMMPFQAIPGGVIGSSQEQRDAFYAAQSAEQLRRMKLLFEHYQVPETDPVQLLWKLAERHVPGLQFEKAPRGPKKRWNPIVTAILAIDVEDLLASKKGEHSVRWACGVLAKRDPWRRLLKARSSAATAKPGDALRKQYELAELAQAARLRSHPQLDAIREEFGAAK